MAIRKSALLLAGGVAFVVAPPLGPVFKASMTTHMALQIPLLVLFGWWVGRVVELCAGPRWAAWAGLRWAAFVVAASTLSVWMIPRLLDLAVQVDGVDAIKALSLVLLGGAPLRFAWSHFGPVARGIVHVEALASLWRLGWIYMDSPSRLCTQYGLDDQQRLGGLLVKAGCLYAAWLLWRALMPDVIRTNSSKNKN